MSYYLSVKVINAKTSVSSWLYALKEYPFWSSLCLCMGLDFRQLTAHFWPIRACLPWSVWGILPVNHRGLNATIIIIQFNSRFFPTICMIVIIQSVSLCVWRDLSLTLSMLVIASKAQESDYVSVSKTVTGQLDEYNRGLTDVQQNNRAWSSTHTHTHTHTHLVF